MFYIVQTLVPIFVCVVLPVMIVWLICRANMNSDNKRAQVLIEAIKANKDIDTNALANAFKKKKKSKQEILLRRLLIGSCLTLIGIFVLAFNLFAFIENYSNEPEFVVLSLICLSIGLSYLIVYFMGRKQPAKDEIGTEE